MPVWPVFDNRLFDIRSFIVTFLKVAQRLIDFVLYDRRFKQLGIRGGAKVMFHEIWDREPIKDEIEQVVRDFWQLWHERFDNPRSLPPIGGGSPHDVLEELSPWQENAIRLLEDGTEAEQTIAPDRTPE